MTDRDVIPRNEVRDALISALRDGSVLLYGPRRVGKSTFLDGLAAAPPHGHVVVRLDLEGFLARPVEDLADQLRKRLREIDLIAEASPVDRVAGVQASGFGVNLRGPDSVPAWDRLRDDLIAAVGRLPELTRLVVALDEVPWWIDAIVDREGAPAGRAALASLRRLRQEPALIDRMRLVLTGSIGLAGLASAIGASAELNDLATVLMHPMSPEQGATLFETEMTALSRPCSRPAAAWAAKLAGGSPHWIKRLAAHTTKAGAPDDDAVNAAAEALLAPALRKQFADEGQEHFRRRHADVYPALAAMLEALSVADAGLPRQGAINAALQAQPDLGPARARECLYLLIDGFYLAEEQPGGTLAWVNPLFRRWWLRYGGA